MDKASSSEGRRLADRSTIPIGALIPRTRPGWVEAGRHLLGGLELAVSEINDAGGIIGRPLGLLVRDTAADPNRAMEAVDELASQGVVASCSAAEVPRIDSPLCGRTGNQVQPGETQI